MAGVVSLLKRELGVFMEAMKFLARKFNAVDMFRIDSNNQLNIKE